MGKNLFASLGATAPAAAGVVMITTCTTEERERPVEWLRSLEQDPRLYSRLVHDAGGFARAAYRLALARCRVQPLPMHIPNVRELRAAAHELALRTGSAVPLPNPLLDECHEAGLPVLGALATARVA